MFLYLAVFTRVYLCLHECTYVYPSLLVFFNIYLCLLVFTYVYHRLIVFTYVYLCLLMFTYVYPCLLLFTCLLVFTYAYHCLLVLFFTYFYPCLLVFNYVYSCLPMFTIKRMEAYKTQEKRLGELYMSTRTLFGTEMFFSIDYCKTFLKIYGTINPHFRLLRPVSNPFHLL